MRDAPGGGSDLRHPAETQVNFGVTGGHAVGQRRLMVVGVVGGANPARVTEMDQMKTESRCWSDRSRLLGGGGRGGGGGGGM